MVHQCAHHTPNCEVSTTYIYQLTVNSQLVIPVVISISDSDSEDDRRWILTPPGTPPSPLTSTPAAATTTTRTNSPPAYHVHREVTSFDFAFSVEAFLRCIDVGPRALCIIDVARDFESSSWNASFLRAGLSEENAVTLEELFVSSLTKEQGFVHLAALDNAQFTTATGLRTGSVSDMSVRTESHMQVDG